jgi:hypothetical protein
LFPAFAFAAAAVASAPLAAGEAPVQTGAIHIAGTVPPHASIVASAWAPSPVEPGAAGKSVMLQTEFTYTGNARGLAVSVVSPALGAQLPYRLSEDGVRQDSADGRLRLNAAGAAPGLSAVTRTIEVRLPVGLDPDGDALRDGLVLVIAAP